MFALLVSPPGGTQPGSTVMSIPLFRATDCPPAHPNGAREHGPVRKRTDMVALAGSGHYGWPVLSAASFPKPEVAGDRGPGRDGWPSGQAASSRAARRGLARDQRGRAVAG